MKGILANEAGSLMRLSGECVRHAERNRPLPYDLSHRLAQSYAVLHVRYREQARSLIMEAKAAQS